MSECAIVTQPWGKWEPGVLIKNAECHKVVMASLASRLQGLLCGIVLNGYHMLTLPFKTGHDESTDSFPREGEPTWATQEFRSLAKRKKGFLLSSPALFLMLLPCLSRKTNALLKQCSHFARAGYHQVPRKWWQEYWVFSMFLLTHPRHSPVSTQTSSEMSWMCTAQTNLLSFRTFPNPL